MKKCILLLDSDPTFCEEAKIYLASFGHKVIIAYSVDEALKYLNDKLPAIFFLNVTILSLAAPFRIESFAEKIDGHAKVVALTHHYHQTDDATVQLMNRTVFAIHRDSPLSEFRYFLT